MRVTALKTKIVTTRVDETRAFYERCFGMQVIEEWSEPGDRGCILAFPDTRGEAYLEIYAGDAEHDFAGLSLQFKVEDLEAFRASLPNDVEVRGPTTRPWGSTYLYLTDPAGVPVVVFEGGL